MQKQIQYVVVNQCAGFMGRLVLPLREQVGVINEDSFSV